MAYIIVKNAGSSWPYYFIEDPKMGAVHASYSAHDSYTGRTLNIKPSYEDYQEAIRDCEKMNKANPVGDYEVCVLKE